MKFLIFLLTLAKTIQNNHAQVNSYTRFASRESVLRHMPC
jgi:hypothetical protein